MKNIKKIVCFIMIAVLSLSIFTACSGGGGSDDAKNSQLIRIAVDVSNTEVNIINKLIEGFSAKEENKDISFKVIKMTQGYDTYVQKNFGKSTMADIISVYDYNSEYWTSMNLLKSISSYLSADGFNESDYVSSVINLGKSGAEGDTNYYWLPRDYNKVVVCYNTEMFKLAKIDAPSDDWTMEDFNDVCEKLNASANIIKSTYDKYDFWPVEMNINWTAVYYPYIKSYGGDLLADDGTLFKNVDTVKSAVNSLLSYADRTDGTYYEGKGYSNPIGQSGSSVSAFTNKQAAMIFTVRPNVQGYATSLDNKINFVSLPTITDNGDNTSYIGTGCTGYGITSGCSEEKTANAWKFLKYIVSKEGQEILGKTGSGVPVLKSLLENNDAEWKKFISADLNHDAFVKYPERDLLMNYVHGFATKKQLTVYKELKDNFIYGMYNSKDRDADFNAFKSRIDAQLK